MRKYSPLIFILAAFFLLTAFTWARWGDIQIDCGREMYVPAAMTTGKMLYRDLWYPYGPLAPYWNAALFRAFGARLIVLYVSGLGITLVFALVLFGVSQKLTSAAAGCVVTLMFLLQAFVPGLFNYVLPYSYAATLGSLFSLLCLYLLIRNTGEWLPIDFALAGATAGLALLSKIEFGLAAVLTLAVAVVWNLLVKRSWRVLGRDIILCIPGLAVAAAVYAWWARQLSLRFLLDENIWPRYFMQNFGAAYLRQNGFRFVPREFIFGLFVDLLSIAIWFAVALLVIRLAARRPSRARLAGRIAGSAAAVFIVASIIPRRWVQFLVFPIGMYWLAVVPLIGGLWLLYRGRRPAPRHAALILAAFYSMMIAVRTSAHILPYGYSSLYNHLPMLLFIAVITTIPFLARRDAAASTAAYCVLAAEAAGLVVLMKPNYEALPSVPLATARGTIYTRTDLAQPFRDLMEFIDREKVAGRKVAIVPEATALYFFCGAEAPTRWYVTTPGVVGPEAEEQFIRNLIDNDVDTVIVSNRSTFVYGTPYFGIDYNQRIWRWITENYAVERQVGRFQRAPSSPFSALIYRRNSERQTRAYSTVSGERAVTQ